MINFYKQFNQNDTLRAFLCLVLVFSLISVSVFYIFSISWGVKEAVRKQKKMAELKFFEEKNKILEGRLARRFKELDLDYAYKLGFVDAEHSVRFATRAKAVAKAKTIGF
jgi:hypothetical protein